MANRAHISAVATVTRNASSNGALLCAINEAIAAANAGEVIKPVLVFE